MQLNGISLHKFEKCILYTHFFVLLFSVKSGLQRCNFRYQLLHQTCTAIASIGKAPSPFSNYSTTGNELMLNCCVKLNTKDHHLEYCKLLNTSLIIIKINGNMQITLHCPHCLLLKIYIAVLTPEVLKFEKITRCLFYLKNNNNNNNISLSF